MLLAGVLGFAVFAFGKYYLAFAVAQALFPKNSPPDCFFTEKPSQVRIQIKEKSTDYSVLLAGVLGFEPRECWSQSPMPYRLAIPHR